MPIDLEERFRYDPGEDDMSPELRLEAEADLQEQAAQQSAAAAVTESAMEEPTATAAPQPTPQQPPTSTEVDPETERLAALEEAKKFQDPRFYAEQYAAIPTGVLDFATDVDNVIPGVEIPKLPEFQYAEYQAARDISGIVVPTLTGTAKLKGLGVAANTRVGWNLGNNKFIQWMGNRGVEALAGLGVGLVSSDYEDHNATGTLKKSFPKTYDWIPDDVATLDSDSLTKNDKRISKRPWSRYGC